MIPDLISFLVATFCAAAVFLLSLDAANDPEKERGAAMANQARHNFSALQRSYVL